MIEQYKVDIPEGQSGEWRVVTFEVTREEETLQELRCMLNPQRPRRVVPAGRYTGLLRDGEVIMSDTPDEIRDHLEAIEATPEHGHCLVAGLGLGMVAEAMLKRSQNVRVTVLEMSRDVIELVGNPLKERYGGRLEIIQTNALKWRPEPHQVYDVVWFDIWDNISMDNLPEMETVNRRYARKSKWKGCWQQEGCRKQRERINSGKGWY